MRRIPEHAGEPSHRFARFVRMEPERVSSLDVASSLRLVYRSPVAPAGGLPGRLMPPGLNEYLGGCPALVRATWRR